MPARHPPAPDPAAPPPRLIAALELGTTSVRMAVAQVDARGSLRVLDSLQQAVPLGKDTFTRGQIERATTEECVRALRTFRKVMSEYGVQDRNIRAVATSALREAANREAILDRIQVATGIAVDVIDPAEVSRLTYLAVRPTLERDPLFRKTDTLVIEVGGGSTEALVFRSGRVRNAHLYRLGSLRLRQSLDAYHVPGARQAEILKSQIAQTLNQILASIRPVSALRMVALGGDARFAASRLLKGQAPEELARVTVPALSRFAATVLPLSPDEVVHRWGVTYPEAETLGPALAVYDALARALELDELWVGRPTLREGLLREMSVGISWSEEFRRQIINSAMEIGRRYRINQRHARQVARYSRRIFQAMRAAHGLDDRYELMLMVAAYLHETGLYISSSGHHKHSMYIIMNSDIFGLGSREILITALIARYHRRALPKPVHQPYASLSREDKIVVAKLAAILRIANALDRGRSGAGDEFTIQLDEGTLVIGGVRDEDAPVVRQRLRERVDMFEQVYGLRVELRGQKASTARGTL